MLSKLVPFDSLQSCSNFVFKMHLFETFAFEKYRDFETRVSSHSRSLRMTLFDRSHTTIYSCLIVTIALAFAVP